MRSEDRSEGSESSELSNTALSTTSQPTLIVASLIAGLHEKHPQNWLQTHISTKECAEVKDAMKAAGLSMDKLPADCK